MHFLVQARCPLVSGVEGGKKGEGLKGQRLKREGQKRGGAGGWGGKVVVQKRWKRLWEKERQPVGKEGHAQRRGRSRESRRMSTSCEEGIYCAMRSGEEGIYCAMRSGEEGIEERNRALLGGGVRVKSWGIGLEQ